MVDNLGDLWVDGGLFGGGCIKTHRRTQVLSGEYSSGRSDGLAQHVREFVEYGNRKFFVVVGRFQEVRVCFLDAGGLYLDWTGGNGAGISTIERRWSKGMVIPLLEQDL